MQDAFECLPFKRRECVHLRRLQGQKSQELETILSSAMDLEFIPFHPSVWVSINYLSKVYNKNFSIHIIRKVPVIDV